MAKKEFKVNPAMNFISQETIDRVEQAGAGDPKPAKEKAPAGYKKNPEYIETRSRRAQILITPSLHKEAKKVAKKLGISLNDFINRAIQEATYNEYVQKLIKEDIEG